MLCWQGAKNVCALHAPGRRAPAPHAVLLIAACHRGSEAASRLMHTAHTTLATRRTADHGPVGTVARPSPHALPP
jgi:hypothetical protein